MDDSETPAYNLQIEPLKGWMSSWWLCGKYSNMLAFCIRWKWKSTWWGWAWAWPAVTVQWANLEVWEQDSLNNNESCTPSCEGCKWELRKHFLWKPQDGQALLRKDHKIPGSRSSRGKRGTVKKIPQGIFF